MKLFSSLHLRVSPIKKVVFVGLVAMLAFLSSIQAANFVVTSSAAGTDPGTLGGVMNAVNAAGNGPHTVTFTVSTCQTGWTSVAINVNNVTVTGGFTGCDPNVVIQGPSGAGAFNIVGNNNVVRGIQFLNVEMNISGSTNKVVGCWFNLNSTGTAAAGSSGTNKAIGITGTGNVIGMASPCTYRNVFSGYSPVAYSSVIQVGSGADNTAIAGNYIGSEKTGMTKTFNNNIYSIYVNNASSVRIDSNTVVGSGLSTIYTEGTTNNLTIRKNNIGVRSDGRRGINLGSPNTGMWIASSGTTIVINANVVCENGSSDDAASSSGILLNPTTGTLSGITVSFNKIGVDTVYDLAGNKHAGLYLRETGGNIQNVVIENNVVGDNGYFSTAGKTDPTVKKSHGISLLNMNAASATNVVFRGNHIGVTPAGANIGNWGDGISILSSSGITIGTATTGGRNYFGYNKGLNSSTTGFPVSAAIIIGRNASDPSSSNVIVYNNSIGISQAGTAAPSTDYSSTSSDLMGIIVENGANNITIGGIGANQGNIITNVANTGVLVYGNATTTQIRGNSIYCNGGTTGKGISLSLGTGGAANNPGTVGNNSYGDVTVAATPFNEPVITAQSASSVTVKAPNNATVDLYGVSASHCHRDCDLGTQPNKQQGYQYITSGTANASGDITFNGSFAYTEFVAVATGTDGSSEFSTCRVICNPPTTPTISGDITPCINAGDVTFSISPEAGVTYDWDVTGGLTIVGADNLTSVTVTIGATGGTITITKTNGCGNSSATETITIVPLPTVAISGGPVCSGQTATVTATPAGATSYTWSTPAQGSLSSTSIASPTYTAPTVSSSTNVNLSVSVTVNGCSNTGNGSITVNPLPVVAISGGPVCSGQTATVTTTPAGATSYTWSTPSQGSLSSTSIASPTYTAPTVSSSTNVNLSVSVTANGCSNTGNGTITVNPLPVVAISGGPVCSGLTATVTATPAGATSYTWSTPAQGSLSSTSIENPTYTAPTVASSTNVNLSVSVTANGCTNTGNGTITVNPLPVVAISGGPVCSGGTATVTATPAGATSYTWSTPAQGSLSSTSVASPTFTAPTTASNTTVNLSVSVTVNGCSNTGNGTINVDGSVSADAGNATITSCANPISLAAVSPSLGTGAWSVVSGSGTISDNNDPNATFGFTGSAPVSAQVRWTVTNGTCSANDVVDLSLTTGPVANATDVAPICSDNVTSSPISANVAAGGTWAIVSSSTGSPNITSAGSASTTVTGLEPGSTTVLSWTVTSGSCPTPAVDQITIHVDANPAIDAGSGDDLCNATTATLGATGTGTWTTTSGTGVVTTPTSPTSGITGLTIGGTSVFTWTVKSANEACTVTDDVTFTSMAAPTADAGDDITSCASSVDLDANGITGSGVWTVQSGSGDFADDTDPNTSVSNLGSGTNVFVWTVSGGGVCTDATSQVTVSTGASDLILEAFGDDDTLCVGSERKLRLEVDGGSQDFTYVWTSIPSGFNVTTTDPIITVVPSGGYTQYVVYAYDNNAQGCLSDDDTVNVYAITRQELYLPNLMTPNEDGHNDVYIIKDVRTGDDILPGSYFEVVNRWGQQVYKSDSYDNTWNAREQSDGMYFYYLETGCGDEIYKGWVQILGNNKP